MSAGVQEQSPSKLMGMRTLPEIDREADPIAAGGLLTGIRFTMALFIADPALGQDLLNPAKPGVLSASAVFAVAGLLTLAWLTSKRPIANASAETLG